MSNHLKIKPIGIDEPIQALQVSLFKKLNWGDIEIYGRIYRGMKDSKVLPQAYKSNGEYLKDVFTNDQKNANIFFIADENQTPDKSNTFFNTEVKIVFMVDLKKAFPAIAHRADAEAQQHALKIIKRSKEFRSPKIQTGLKNVLKGFYSDGVEKSDIEPRHTFAIVTQLSYKINC